MPGPFFSFSVFSVKIISMDGYKTIKINNFGNEAMPVVENFFSAYPKGDLKLEMSNGELFLHLRQIDYFDLKNKIDKQVASFQGSDKKQRKALLSIFDGISNIKSYGLNGNKRIYVGYNKERKLLNRKDKEKERGQFFYARENDFKKNNNELPENCLNKIIVGDSEGVLRSLPDNCVDLIFTSPPYNFGLNYDNHKDGTDWNDYFKKLFAVFEQCVRVLKYGGRIAVNVQPLFSDYIPLHHIVSNYFMRQKMIWKGEIVWDKHNWNCKYTAWGSWKSPSNPYLKYTWEFVEIFSKGTLKKDGQSLNADITADEFKKLVFAKWDVAPERKMKEFGHPAMFPEKLAYQILKLFSFKNDIILDPFNGAGTTTFMAKKTGRRYIGIDVSSDYCEKAEARIKEMIKNQTLFD